MPRGKQIGFTLIELLIVISIIGILSGVIISVLDPSDTRSRASDAVTRAMIEKMVISVQAYHSAFGHYPNCAQFQRVVTDSIGEITETNCEETDADDTNITFSIAGVELPHTCTANGFYGQGSQECHFHFNGNWNTASTPLSPHFYVKTWADETEYFCWNPPYTNDQILIDCDRTCGELQEHFGTNDCY